MNLHLQCLYHWICGSVLLWWTAPFWQSHPELGLAYLRWSSVQDEPSQLDLREHIINLQFRGPHKLHHDPTYRFFPFEELAFCELLIGNKLEPKDPRVVAVTVKDKHQVTQPSAQTQQDKSRCSQKPQESISTCQVSICTCQVSMKFVHESHCKTLTFSEIRVETESMETPWRLTVVAGLYLFLLYPADRPLPFQPHQQFQQPIMQGRKKKKRKREPMLFRFRSVQTIIPR